MMKKKAIKYLLGIVLAGFVIYNSFYLRPLDEKLAEENKITFDAKAYVDEIWENDLFAAYDSSLEICLLIDKLRKDAEGTFQREANALGIGNIGYFKVKGVGEIVEVYENNVLLLVGEQLVEIETEFIFGNAVRDASGLVKVNDYDRTSDFNLISETINDRIRQELIPGFRASVEIGNKVSFQGALELNRAHLDLNQPEVIPVSIQILP